MKRTIMVGALAALAACALGQAKLSTVQHSKAGSGLQIAIHGEGLANPRTMTVMGGTSYIVEFNGVLTGRAMRGNVGTNGVKWYEAVQYTAKPPKVRVHIKKTAGSTPTLAKIDGTWTVTFGTRAVVAPKPVATDGFVEDLRSVALEPAQPTIKPTVSAPKLPEPFASSVEQFPTTVPPIEKPTERVIEKPVEKPVVKTAAPAPAKPARTVFSNDGATAKPPVQASRLVSLDFVGTDIVQILKALSIQASVNIISSPDVSPGDKPVRLTLSLNDVTVDDALSMITAMSGLRYGRVGSTFVVTPAGTFSEAMRTILQRSASSYETRVVNLMSGEAKKIKEATLKALPQDGRNGFYEIVIPGDEDAIVSVPATGQGTEGAAGNGGDEGQAQPSQAAPTATKKQRAFYMMLVGDPGRIGAVEVYVRDLDARIASSFSLSRSADMKTVVVPVQSGQTARIKTMIEGLLANNPRASDYSFSESQVRELSEGELSTRVLLMIGPAGEIDTIGNFVRALDKDLCAAAGISYENDFSALDKHYEVVELNYLEPIVAEQDLKGRFRGLWVTVAPDPVTPGIKGTDESTRQEGPTETGDGGQGGQGQAAPASAQDSKLERAIGREPMKLILRGTQNQIDEAKKYLAMIDVAPRQVALELRVVELTKEDAMKLGLDWSIVTGGRLGTIRVNQGTGLTPGSPGAISGDYTYQGSDTVSFLGELDKKLDNRKLIARPNALVSDGRSTDLFVGDTVRYIKSIQTSQNGITVVTDEIKVGVKFDIKARLGGDGAIALDLMQNFSLLTGFTPVPGGGQLPQTSDRTTTLFVNMKSGETIALGGLILEQDRRKVNGIPLLMDIPIIGQLFRRTEDSKVRTEIVFFLTAVEVNAANRPNAASPRTSLERTPDPVKEYTGGGVRK
jgi:type II secretory pathway component GspD/PulD (secretin)